MNWFGGWHTENLGIASFQMIQYFTGDKRKKYEVVSNVMSTFAILKVIFHKIFLE